MATESSMTAGPGAPQDTTVSKSQGASALASAGQGAATSGAGTAQDTSNSPAETSPFSAPKISLPTGGGAIRGIGEKFQTNAATGTGKLSVPLGLSKGRLGFSPDLSLSHDSGSGNGIFGIGWSLSSISITRKTDKGLPKYRRREEAECDVFILSGSEDLVPVLIRDEEGRWVDDEFELDGHRVKRYRPRIEGLFARIERWTRLDDGDEHWRSISKDNTLSVYGRDERSRIFDPQNRHHVFSWLICESYDDKGNAIVYEYAAENDDGVDLSRASEQRRIRTANRYPKRILYGNRRPLLRDNDSPGFRPSHVTPPDFGQAHWMFEVVFDYGEGHYHAEPADSHGCEYVRCTSELPAEAHWPVRRDPFSRYRSCFEIRTYRLCHRVLMFHHFPKELGARDYLVRSTEFTYRQKPVGSFITKITQSGYVRQHDGRYLKRSMPPLDLDYTSSPLENEGYLHFEVKEVDPSSLQNLPEGIDGQRFRWIDLNGEGISGVLSEEGTGWFYKPNAGQGRFGATELVAEKPSLAALNAGRQQLLDVAGAGTLNLVQFDGAAAGFFERTLDDGWGYFRAFRSLPVLDWKDPNLRFVDVTGDGIADILITEDDAFLWHESLLDEGFGPAIRVTVPTDEDHGPHVIFADGVQSIYVADMSGDGMLDLVRIRKHEVCVWHNHGYGVFGPKIVMDNAPCFDDDTLFDQARVKLADTDGNGCTDIVYLGHDGIRIYVNESGNSWSSARKLPQFFPANSQTSVSVVDFLGRGTACILWSSTLPGDSTRSLRYIDLMDGQKPHLLVKIANNLGAETRVEYASSTEFYLSDKAEGHPWLTRLPFPVHVVKRVETYDYVSLNRFVTSYTYHHGFFDGLEREFRGFGRVDQLDTEDFASLSQSADFPVGDNIDRTSSVPPALTKTWFHTGVFLGNGYVSRHLAHEYYREPALPHAEGEDPLAAMLLDDTILPDFLNAMEAREACRALKGTTLRQEIYALDGKEESSRPYSVAESNATIVTLQPFGHNLHAVFFTHPRESVTFHYERKLYEVEGCRRADPRVSHSATLEVDDYGNVLESVSIGYGRRFPNPSHLLTDEDRAKQREPLLTLSQNRFTNAVLERHSYRIPIVAETRNYQLVNLNPWACQRGITNLFRFEELLVQVGRASDGRHDLPYEDVNNLGATGDSPYRRLLDENRTYYRSDRLDRILPLGVTEALALPGQNYKLAFTPGLLAQVYHRGEAHDSLIPDIGHVLHHEAKYVDLTGNGQWWIPSGKVFYAPHECDAKEELLTARRHFFQLRRFVDPFHHTTVIAYDSHDLSPVEARDAVGNITTAEIDYRVVSPYRLTDANRNRSEVAFDALGLVVGTAVMGKMGQRAGDSLDGFHADLDQATIVEHFAHPLHDPHSILKLATTRLVYDLFAYMRTRDQQQPQPAGVYTMARETHAADLRPGHRTKIQHVFSYSDGFQREIQKKIQAEPGPLTEGGPDVNPRWVGSGWTIYNNKGKPVRQYEPFFSTTSDFEFANIVGVSAILFYDPVDRVVATLHPNHTYDKVVFDPWRQETWDVNDTVLESPADDTDVSDFFAKLPDSDYLPTWYEQRRHGQVGKQEQQAALKTAVHAKTPIVSHLDTLGRTFLSVAHNRFERDGIPVDQYFSTRTELDIEGNQRAVIDALGRIVMHYDYDMLKTQLRQTSVDSGTRWKLNDAVGKLLLLWDSRGHRFRHEYDALHRPTNFYVRRGYEPEFLAERIVYGEGQPNDLALNLRNKTYQQFDAAGLITNERYDFKGNLLKSTRRLLEDYRNEVNWAKPPELESHAYSSSTTYDALNRAITLTTPDSSVCRPKYNEANLLESLAVNLRGSDELTPFVAFINYNAKGQRTIIDYGNGSHTRYDYDPLTFRMIHLETRRKKDHERLQDLHYTFDPVGNITSIRDDAQETVYFKNKVVSPRNEYVYDATYRLNSADGREPAVKSGEPQTTYNDVPRMNHPLPSDGHALHRYREHYDYDAVGNILKLLHAAPNGNWARLYYYDEPHERPHNNRLTRTEVGQLHELYAYDADGNMTRMPHLHRMDWDFKDQLHATRQQASNSDRGETTYYVYNLAGQRVRKVTERASGSRKDERIYIGSFETYRKYDSVGAVTLERETLHVMDGKRRIALVETKAIADERQIGEPAPRIRFQLDNHLGSSVLELDHHASIISYEEYYPYGSTSFEATEAASEVSKKRYRYTGQELDEETGLYHNGARYCAPWLGRWTACDPAKKDVSLSSYDYAGNNPIKLVDPKGTSPEENDKKGTSPGGHDKKEGGGFSQLLHNVLAGGHAMIEGGIWNPTVWGSISRNARIARDTARGVILEKFAGNFENPILNRLTGGLGRYAKDADRATATVVEQIKSTSSFSRVAQITRSATRDAARFIAGDATYAGRAAQARILLPTGTPAAVVRSAENALQNLAKPIPGITAAPRVTTGLPGLGGMALKALGPIGAALSAHALGEDLAKKDYAAAVSDAAGTVAGGLETFALASTALGAGGTTAGVATGGVALAGGGGAAAAASVAAPVVAAFGVGVAAGTLIEKGLNVSEYASNHGIEAQELAKKLGAGETASFVIGAIVTVESTPLAIQEAAVHKGVELASRAWNWLSN